MQRSNMPADIHRAALQALQLCDPAEKCRAAAALFAAVVDDHAAPSASSPAAIALPIPGRPERPRLISPRELPQRGLGTDEGRAAFLHAIAHIEFNAINLALDAIYRFRDLPATYYREWAEIASDEARHFTLLRARLQSLGFDYGDFDAHNGLWDMACRTADDCLARMALVPRVLEARGLDVTPGMIERLKRVGDSESIEILELILREEVAHVAAGSRWFAWCCEQRGLSPEPTFEDLLDQHAPDAVRPPFNEPARTAAGFSAAELSRLVARSSKRA